MSDDNAIIVADGALITVDPLDVVALKFDWGTKHLNTGISIVTSTYTITALAPTGATGLTKDTPLILTAAPYNSRWTSIRILAGGSASLGQMYELRNTIVTDEVPTQTRSRSCRVRIETQ